MASFAKSDLQNWIRSEFRSLDQQRIVRHVLPPVELKAAPGGLPLGFGDQHDDSDDSSDTSSSEDFILDVSTLNSARSTQKAVNLKSTNVIKHNSHRYAIPKQGKMLCMVKKQIFVKPASSYTSELIAAAIHNTGNPFDNYAKFDISYRGLHHNDKVFNVVFPFAALTRTEQAEGKTYFAMNIAIARGGTMGDLIGLSCYLYTEAKRLPPCTSVTDYTLYHAEDGKPEIDFPRIPRAVKVENHNFTELALVPKSSIPDIEHVKVSVTVYLVNKHQYTFDIDNRDVQLREVRDTAVQLRQRDIVDEKQADEDWKDEYFLELLDEPDQMVDLNLTIANVGTTQFVLLRKNSRRGNFDVGGSETIESANMSATPEMINSSSPKKTSQAESFPFTFYVDRIRKLRSRVPITITFQRDRVEIVPVNSDRRRFLVPKRIEFKLIARVELAPEKSHGSGRRQVQLTSLGVSDEHTLEFHGMLNALNRSDSSPVQNMSSFYHDSPTSSGIPSLNNSSSTPSYIFAHPSDIMSLMEGFKWKTMTIETSEDDAWRIALKLSELIESNYSYVVEIYKYSQLGSRSPYISAKKLVQASDKNLDGKSASDSSASRGRRKFSINPFYRLNNK